MRIAGRAKAAAFVFISAALLAASIFTSCKRLSKEEAAHRQDSVLLTSSYGEKAIVLPGKDVILPGAIDDSASMAAFRLLGNPSAIERIMVFECIRVRDSRGDLVRYSVSHFHDATPEGNKNGRAIDIYAREVPGGFVLAGAKMETCFIGNGQ